MKVGIMQPYFLPYIGYFQLINLVDKFVVYDNIQYTKRGWINRNRYLKGDGFKYFTLPLQKDSVYLDVVNRYITKEFDKKRVLNQITETYKKATYYPEVYPLIEKIINFEEYNLFKFIYNSIYEIVRYLDITAEIIVSSSLEIDHTLKAQDKVIAICEYLKADTYINSIGGIDLYQKEQFATKNIRLKFLKVDEDIRYQQFNKQFIENLSIVDVLMFNSKDEIKQMLNRYRIVGE